MTLSCHNFYLYKMVRVLFFCWILLGFVNGFGQNYSQIDSLKNVINTDNNPKNQFDALLELGKKLNPQKDSVEILDYIDRALKIAHDSKDKLMEAKVYGEKSILNYNNYNIQNALLNISKAEDLIKNNNDKETEEYRMSLMYMKGTYLGAQGNVEEQQAYYLKIIPIVEKAKSYKVLSNVYLGLGTLYFNQKEYLNSEKYFLKTIEVLKQMDAPSRNFSNTYLKLALLKIEDGKIADAEQYLIQAKEDVEKEIVSPVSQSNFYNYWGKIQGNKKEYQKALVSFQKSLDLAKPQGNVHAISNNLREIAKIYMDQKEYQKARPYLLEYYDVTKELDDQSMTLGALKYLSRVENKLGNHASAFHYLSQYVAINDSIKSEEVTQKILQLEKQFETAQKEQQITQLQLENERKEWKIKQTSLWIIACISAILILGALTLLLYRNSRNQKLLNQQEKALHDYNLHQIEQKHQIEMLSSLMQGAETERQRLGRDLHDGLGGLLSGIKLKLNSLHSSEQTDQESLESEVKTDLDGAIQEMRFISQSLLPDLMEKYGLSSALEQYCARLSSHQLKIDFQSVNFEGFSDKEKELMFYRIAQELVNNAVKHAEAQEIFVQLQQSDQQVFLTVEDDGIGWEEDKMENGSGWNNLKHRINFLKGNFEYTSQKGEGTSVYINCPV
jgi:two-component system NarL family sensor kinase